ncbi:MAG: hypothetical protein CMH83_15030 [Nocardioides sp.]|nr:hypothetical protein [Nocardioides sp.]
MGALRTAATCLAALACLGLSTTTPAVASPAPTDGDQVDGSTDRREPTPLTAGTYSDELGAEGRADDVHYFSYERVMADSSVLVTVLGLPDPATDGADGLGVSIETPDGEACDDDSVTGDYSSPGRAMSVQAYAGPEEVGERDDPCLRADELWIAVDRGTSSPTTPLPVTLRVVEEAPVVGSTADLPVPPEDAPRLRVPARTDASAAEPVEGGLRPGEATEVEAGTSYATEVDEGVQVWFAVPLTWGEGFTVRVDVPAADAADVEALGYLGATVDLDLVEPAGLQFQGEVAEAPDTGTSYGAEASTIADGTSPVRYLNRFAGYDAAYPGTYGFTLTVAPAPDDREALSVPLTFVVGRTGEAGGAPQFPEVAGGPGGTAGPTSYDASTPYLVGDGVFAAEVGLPGESATAAKDAGADGRPWGVALPLAGASLLSVAGGAVLLRRRARA